MGLSLIIYIIKLKRTILAPKILYYAQQSIMILTQNFDLSVCLSVCLCVCHQDCDEMAGLSNTALREPITIGNSSRLQLYQDYLNPDPNPVDQII